MTVQHFFDYGYPDDKSESHYGLYQPVLDRIVFTVGYKEIAQEIKMLMSSRYSLYVYDLCCANNYQPILIDNECCENWTVSNKTSIKITHSLRENSITPAEKLLHHSIQCEWPVASEKKLMQRILHWIKFSICLEEVFYPWYGVEKFISDMYEQTPGECVDSIRRFRQSMRRIVYLSRDYDQMVDSVEHLISSDRSLSKWYNHWLNK